MQGTFKIGEHTIEFGNGSSSSDTWSRQYAHEIGLSMMTTNDSVNYCRIDEEKIYLIHSTNKLMNLVDALANNAIASWDEFLYFYGDLLNDFRGNFSEIKADIDKSKQKQNEYDKLSPKEKKEYIAKWRVERDAHFEKLKQEAKTRR